MLPDYSSIAYRTDMAAFSEICNTAFAEGDWFSEQQHY
jgi:hypothetical protein